MGEKKKGMELDSKIDRPFQFSNDRIKIEHNHLQSVHLTDEVIGSKDTHDLNGNGSNIELRNNIYPSMEQLNKNEYSRLQYSIKVDTDQRGKIVGMLDDDNMDMVGYNKIKNAIGTNNIDDMYGLPDSLPYGILNTVQSTVPDTKNTVVPICTNNKITCTEG